MSKLNYRFKDTDKNTDNYDDSDYDRDDSKSIYKSYRDNLTLKNKFKKDKFEDVDNLSDNSDDNDDFSNPNRTLHIKEFDMNSLPPHDVSDNSGVKIVVLGKPGCFSPGTKILMYDGSIKNVEDIKIGDKIMGDDGFYPKTVNNLYNDFDNMFDINPILGESYTVNRLHDLVLYCDHDYESYKKGDIIEISVEDYLKKDNRFKLNFKLFKSIPITCWNDKITDLDPYEFGRFLGNKNIYNSSINIDQSILKKYNMSLENIDNNYIIDNLHIPHDYKINSISARMNLLAGLIDSRINIDEYNIDNNNNICRDYLYYIDINSNDTTFLDDVLFLIRSLGFSVIKDTYLIFNDNITCLTILGKDLNKIPTKIINKLYNIKDSDNTDNIICNYYNNTEITHLLSDFTINEIGYGEYYGFSIDGNRRFCLANFEIVKNTGKSTIIQDIMAYKSHICPVIQVFSGTEDSNHFFSEKCPPVCVFNKYDEKSIENFVKRQKIAKKYLDNPWAMQIIDDCTDDPASLRKPLIQSYYKNGRHWKMIHILSLQYCLDIRPNIRSNIDYTFILRESNLKSRKSLHENYAGCIDSFQDFCDIMDQITEDYTALVINNRVQSNKMEDCLFWYKANPNKIPPNWKFGHKDAWSFNNERFDPLYVDSVL
jgi:hypothetical protein